MPARPTRGVVSLPALDLRASPEHAGEMRSQLLMGEVLGIIGHSRDGQWLRVRSLADGYPGWVRSWGVVAATPARARRWTRLARARVVNTLLEVHALPGRGGIVSPLYWGARVIPGRARRGYRGVELPDGRRGWVLSSGLETGGGARLGLAERIRSLIGAPYLWGGRTPFGLDCSGFVQLVLAEQGVLLPRDSRDQFRAARPLRRGEEPREGDLVFFGRSREAPSHVGIALGEGYFAHVRGQVRLSSLDAENPLWDNELAPQLRGFRRPAGPPRRRSRHPHWGGESA